MKWFGFWGMACLAVVALPTAAQATQPSIRIKPQVVIVPPVEPMIEAAASGDPDAEYRLAEAYDGGFFTRGGEMGKADAHEAMKWFTLAAQHGQPDAQAALEATRKDYDETKAARALAEAGDADALYDFAQRLDSWEGRFDPDYHHAGPYYRRAAEAGNADAQAWMGASCEGIESDPPCNILDAMDWYRKAADQGHARAFTRSTELRALYHEYELERDAALTGDAEAQYQLGKLLSSFTYWRFAEIYPAYNWYKKAALQGHPAAMAEVGRAIEQAVAFHSQRPDDPTKLFADDRPDLTAEDARYWYRKAGHAGHRGAAYTLAMYYATLEPPNHARANYWFDRVGPHETTCYLYHTGDLTDRGGPGGWWTLQGYRQERVSAFKETPDQVRAFACYRALAAKSDAAVRDGPRWFANEPHYYLGEMYLNGQGTPRDERKALAEFSKVSVIPSCDDIQARSMAEIARIYVRGKVVTRDAVKAYVLLNHAANCFAERGYFHSDPDDLNDEQRTMRQARWHETSRIAGEIEELKRAMTVDEVASGNQQLRESYDDWPYDLRN